MKTRTNQPVELLNVEDIKELTGEQIDGLECGDIVTKEDGTGKHSYVVTYKKDNVGICLSYFDGSGYIETVSYDYTDGAWVYNSTDVTECSIDEILAKLATKDVFVKTLTQTQANWQADFPTTILSDYYSALGLEMKHPYFRFQVVNNVLRIVLFYRVENNTENAISLNQNDIYGYMSFGNMPTWVKKAIYTDKGTTLNQPFSTDDDRGIFALFRGVYCYGDQYRGTYRGDLRISLNTFESTGNNNIQINVSHSANTSIPPGNSMVFSARTFLTLI